MEKEDRSEYVKKITQMLSEHDAAKESKHKDEIVTKIKEIRCYSLLMFHVYGPICAEELFLTKEEAAESEKKWQKKFLLQTKIRKIKGFNPDEIRTLLPYKTSEEPTFRYTYVISHLNTDGSAFSIFSIAIPIKLEKDVELYLKLMEEKEDILYKVSYSYDPSAEKADDMDQFRAVLEKSIVGY